MKESTGELSMVVVTLLAIALIAGAVRFLVPKAQEYIETQWGKLSDDGKKANQQNQISNGGSAITEQH